VHRLEHRNDKLRTLLRLPLADDPFFSAYILYDLIGRVLWYRALPRLVKRMVLLKLLQLRSGRIKFELSIVLVLASVQVWLMFLLMKGI